MNIYEYKMEKGGSYPNRTSIKLTAECLSDNDYLRTVVKMIEGREYLKSEITKLSDTSIALGRRVSDAQMELANMKKSWVYKVVNLIHYIFDAGRGKD